jgi:thiamine-phosphate pyrophosphorylase
MPYREARKRLGADAILGVSCKASRHDAMVAAEEGASYVAFGAFFDSATKGVTAGVEPEILEWWSSLMVVPSVAIGGITPENCAPLVRAGADFLAVSSGVWRHPDGPEAAIRAFDRAIAAALVR